MNSIVKKLEKFQNKIVIHVILFTSNAEAAIKANFFFFFFH